jgi:hypothetical protein
MALASWGLEVKKKFKGKNMFIDARDPDDFAELRSGVKEDEEYEGEDPRPSQEALDEVSGAEEEVERPSVPDGDDIEDYDVRSLTFFYVLPTC